MFKYTTYIYGKHLYYQSNLKTTTINRKLHIFYFVIDHTNTSLNKKNIE